MSAIDLKSGTKFVDDFKNFLVKGNAVDLAVGIIIGAAFGRVITSLVTDLLTPPISLLVGKVNFANLFVTLSGGHYGTLEAARAAGAVTLNFGTFINVALDFILTAFAVFLLVRVMARLKEKPLPPPNDSRDCPKCLSVVKKAASRCPFCTSEIEAVKAWA